MVAVLLREPDFHVTAACAGDKEERLSIAAAASPILSNVPADRTFSVTAIDSQVDQGLIASRRDSNPNYSAKPSVSIGEGYSRAGRSQTLLLQKLNHWFW